MASRWNYKVPSPQRFRTKPPTSDPELSSSNMAFYYGLAQALATSPIPPETQRDMAILTHEYRDRQRSGNPVHTWDL